MANSCCTLELKTTFGFDQWILLIKTRMQRGGSFASGYEIDRALEKFTKIEFTHAPLDTKTETEVTVRV